MRRPDQAGNLFRRIRRQYAERMMLSPVGGVGRAVGQCVGIETDVIGMGVMPVGLLPQKESQGMIKPKIQTCLSWDGLCLG